MKRTTGWIAQHIEAVLNGRADVVVDGSVETDSRECGAGSLYVARVGENADGHDYATNALATGAVALIVERELDLDAPQLIVEDSTAALGQLARAHLADLRASAGERAGWPGGLQVIGITGSVGKTTTKDLLARICGQVGPTVAPVMSFNNEVGCPLTILRADETTQFLVLEMGASGLGQIAYLTEIAPLDVGIELMVGRAHLGGFGSVEHLAQAKRELVEGILPGGTAVLNCDDPQVLGMAGAAPEAVVTFSAQGAAEATVRARDIELDAFDRPSFCLEAELGRDGVGAGPSSARISLQLAGAHQVVNALAAATGALAMGIGLDPVAAALNEASADSPHRMKIVKTEVAGQKITVIDDSYNANPDSLNAGLESAKRVAHDRRLIAVIGEMLELGDQSAQLHREAGQSILAAGAAIVVALGREAEPLLEPLRGRAECHVAANPDAAIKLVRGLIQTGDVVFVKGSNGSGTWKLADDLMGARNNR